MASLETIAGQDVHDPPSLDERYCYRRKHLRQKGFCCGVIESTEPRWRNFEVAPQAVGEFGTLEKVSPPNLSYGELVQTISPAETYVAFDDFIAAGRTVELTARKLQGHWLAGTVSPAHDRIRAHRTSRIVAEAFVDLVKQYDALRAPSLDVVAGRNDEDFE